MLTRSELRRGSRQRQTTTTTVESTVKTIDPELSFGEIDDKK